MKNTILPAGIAFGLATYSKSNTAGLTQTFSFWPGVEADLALVPVVALSATIIAIYNGHFDRMVPNWLAWIGIAVTGGAVIFFFANLHTHLGVLCTASICPGFATGLVVDGTLLVTNVQRDADLVVGGSTFETVKISRDIRTTLYFSIVTFTTLGYGDMQPLPSMRLYAGAEAIMGYIYLGLGVGAAVDFAARPFRDALAPAAWVASEPIILNGSLHRPQVHARTSRSSNLQPRWRLVRCMSNMRKYLSGRANKETPTEENTPFKSS